MEDGWEDLSEEVECSYKEILTSKSVILQKSPPPKLESVLSSIKPPKPDLPLNSSLKQSNIPSKRELVIKHDQNRGNFQINTYLKIYDSELLKLPPTLQHSISSLRKILEHHLNLEKESNSKRINVLENLIVAYRDELNSWEQVQNVLLPQLIHKTNVESNQVENLNEFNNIDLINRINNLSNLSDDSIRALKIAKLSCEKIVKQVNGI
jgi:hypothetical protein